eukprot:CAMPEP_0171701936 /NCGR_PEP_ID=MMETSP0991-20121206/11328_1 /TAXON_ID=483369 /ORGANISM="non described non described, Strain CCMP2098" /LENGTH=233 /DNA_ID=CAMNT_0012291245 /DNA_START=77 /DNA_END=778 /DNA_ORIENTATION=+
MGKGFGKGAGKGACNGDSAYKTKEGECGGGAGAYVLFMEIIGSFINIYPACCMCCHFPGCGCCCGCFVLMSGWGGIFGASAPSCCGKTAKNLKILAAMSVVAFFVRGLVVAVLSASISELNAEKEAYEKCIKNKGKEFEAYCEDEHLAGKHMNIELQKAIIEWLTFALIITLIWITVSMVGAYFGKKGADAENKAAQGAGVQVELQGAIAHGTVVQAKGAPVLVGQPVASPPV